MVIEFFLKLRVSPCQSAAAEPCKPFLRLGLGMFHTPALAPMGNAASAGTLTVGYVGAKTGRRYLEESGASSVPVQINATT